MSGIFQGYTNSNGRVRASQVAKVPAGSANDRGMIVAGNRVIPYELDAGQPRVLHDGIAFDNVTGMLLAATTPFGQTNISMGGLLVDSRGAVMLTDGAAQVIHQGVGLQNNGRLSIESEPIATFIAHLSNNVASTTGPGTFTRASDGLYLGADGNWRIAPANEPRFENGQLLKEPAITNKNTNYNASPDAGLINIAKGGDASSILSRVLDVDRLSDSGLSGIGNGYVIELDNSAGSSNATATINGITGNTNAHTFSAFAVQMDKDLSAPRIQNNAGTLLVTIDNTKLYKRSAVSGLPAGAGNTLQLLCPAGASARMILNQLEESPVVSSPIITLGAAGQRVIDELSWADSASFFNQAQGMALITLNPRYSKADQAAVLQGLLSLDSASSSNLLFMDGSIKSTDGTNTAAVVAPAFSSGDELKIAAVYGPTGASALQVGYSLNGAAWVWSPAVAYDGGFTLVAALILARAIILPGRYSDVSLYDENRGAAWVESNY